jgi:hypothetical protein
VPERVLLFCLASETNWVKAGVSRPMHAGASLVSATFDGRSRGALMHRYQQIFDGAFVTPSRLKGPIAGPQPNAHSVGVSICPPRSRVATG